MVANQLQFRVLSRWVLLPIGVIVLVALGLSAYRFHTIAAWVTAFERALRHHRGSLLTGLLSLVIPLAMLYGDRRTALTGRTVSLQITALTVLALGVRLYRIDARALWMDEAFRLWVAQRPLLDVWRWVVRIDTHPPLYYTLLHFWLALGDRGGTLRLLSTICGALTVPLVYLVGRAAQGHRLGIVAALLWAVIPFSVWYSQDANIYALLAFAATAAMAGFAWLLRYAEICDALPSVRHWRARWQARPESPRPHAALVVDLAWTGCVIGTAAALWSEYTAIFLPIAMNVIVLYLILCGYAGKRFLRNWLLSQLVVATLCIPLLPMLLPQLLGPNFPSWIPVPTARSVLEMFWSMYLPFVDTGRVRFAIDLIGAALVASAVWTWRRDKRWLVFTVALALTPILGELIGSIHRPMFLTRTLIWTAVPLYLAIAAGLNRLRMPWVWAATLTFVLFANFWSLRTYYWIPSLEPWDEAARYVAQRTHTDDLVIFYQNYGQLPFDYYFRRDKHLNVDEHGIPFDFGARFELYSQLADDGLYRVESLARTHDRVWLIYNRWMIKGSGDHHELIPAILSCLGDLTEHRVFVAYWEQVDVRMYQIADNGRRPAAGPACPSGQGPCVSRPANTPSKAPGLPSACDKRKKPQPGNSALREGDVPKFTRESWAFSR